jgi:hypothetical protein
MAIKGAPFTTLSVVGGHTERLSGKSTQNRTNFPVYSIPSTSFRRRRICKTDKLPCFRVDTTPQLFGAGACHEVNNYEQSQIFINLCRDTTPSRAAERFKKSPPPGPLFRGPSEVFRIVKVIRISRPHDSLPGIDSCCTVAVPALTLGLWPPVGSNTETDDDCRRRQFSIGKLSVRTLPFQSNNSRRKRRTRVDKWRKMR